MKDWPVTYRLAILVALLLLLFLIIRQFWKQPGELPVEKVVVNEVVGGSDSEFQERELYPQVPAVLPDLNENYLFNSERSFEGEEIQAPDGVADETVDLEEINYTGSMIVGDIRKGLITYQDNETVAGGSPPPGGRGASPRRTSAKTVTKNKQLTIGENFMGYTVEKIEPDRLVLKKGDEMIVKLLYDSGEERSGIGEPIRSQPNQAGAATVGRSVPARAPIPPKDSRRMTPPANSTFTGDRTIRSRSELLRGLDPNFGAPSDPGEQGGDPLRRR